MTSGDEERDIRTRFEAAREHDEANAPSFREILERPRPKRRSPVFAAGTVLIATIAAVTYLLWNEKPAYQQIDAPASSFSDWHSPTDFLLKTPGLELLETTPEIPSTVPDLSNFQKITIPTGSAR